MTQHHLQGRSDAEIQWYQRRSFLQAAATWTALGGAAAAQAQARSNIVELQGDVDINGTRLRPDHTVQSGDRITTGPGSTVIFVLGQSAFHVRQNSSLTLERGPSLNAVSLLRLLSGAVISVWGKGSARKIVTPTLTVGIRGTGVYTEVFPKENGRTYFCNCYGTVDLVSASDQITSQSEYHQAFWSNVPNSEGVSLTVARMMNHSDTELEFLARLAHQRTAWQISGKKANRNGKGY